MKISPFLTVIFTLLYCNVNFVSGLENVPTRPLSPLDFDQDSNRIVQIIKPETIEDYVEDLSQPLDFSQLGIDEFFHRFNHKLYAQLVLPHGALSVHVIAFCRQGAESEQGPDFYNSLFRIFTRRIKATQYMDALDVEYFITKLPDLLSYLYEAEQKNSSAKLAVKDILYDDLSNKFELLQEQPETFLENLSKKICAKFIQYDSAQKGDVTIHKLRITIMKILDACLSKLAWSQPYDRDIWDNFKLILQAILHLKLHHIITDSEDIKDLIDTATIRFCHFVNLTGGLLPVDFYHAVNEDLKSHIMGIDDFEEELDCISTMREIIQATMIENVGKAVAKERFGLLAQENMQSL
ncbi:hypothetical protein A3F06_00595 [candidate division TM6 bacterium RIFCSPHIGHO2_12_FULL_36_22]|nr:MAG: hypothetical protein A3F06_00595 [candidate division TM6 bacterium RIFCSPHIGHO2_12_FULL_36_22]